jgi:sodium transport system permease protein
MRWSIIRLIWARELRDQLRDRRTLFMVAVLPLLIYPVLGFAVLQFALGFSEKKSFVGIRAPAGTEFPEHSRDGKGKDYPPLFINKDGRFTFAGKLSPAKADGMAAQARLEIFSLEGDGPANPEREKPQLILSAARDFYSLLEKAETADEVPALTIEWDKEDDYARLALERLKPLVEAWKGELRRARLGHKGLPSRFDEPFDIHTPKAVVSQGGLFDLLVRIFPFMLVMWSLAGALYPAVDLCAGEKERGTMETLLISPAGREEIVWGKFLTIWVFSAGTALLNLASMGLTTWQFSARAGAPVSRMKVNGPWPLSLARTRMCLVSASR